MPKHRTDSDAIEQALTRLENTMLDRYTAHRGDNHETAIAPRVNSGSAGESPERVRHRLAVRQQIRDRIAEPPVTAEEIIGTLASHMRGDLSQLLDESGQIDFKLIKERRLGHLLKSVTITVRHTEATEDKPAEVKRKTRVQLHSPRKAAAALARLAGIERRRINED